MKPFQKLFDMITLIFMGFIAMGCSAQQKYLIVDGNEIDFNMTVDSFNGESLIINDSVVGLNDFNVMSLNVFLEVDDAGMVELDSVVIKGFVLQSNGKRKVVYLGSIKQQERTAIIEFFHSKINIENTSILNPSLYSKKVMTGYDYVFK